MGVLQRFERIEGMVNGAFARAFKAEVQPVEIASALQRELDDRAAIVAQGRTLVPNDFVVELSERDSERSAGTPISWPPSSSTWCAAMPTSSATRSSVRSRSRSSRRATCETGVFRVRSSAKAGVTPMQQPTSGRPGIPHPVRSAQRPD